MERRPVSSYDHFAGLYSSHWGGFSRRIVPVLERLLLEGLPRDARLLDVCCGAGHLAAELSALGFHVTALDSSRSMIEQARRNAPRAELLVRDARAFAALGPPFDAATCLFDSLNHMMTLDEVTAVFANVRDALAPSGRFLFDMNMEEGYLGRWQGAIHVVEEERVCLVRARYDPARKLGHNDVTMFERRAGSRWRRRDLTMVQRCYERDDVVAALSACGFTDVRAHDGERDLGLENAAGRLFFVCRKAG